MSSRLAPVDRPASLLARVMSAGMRWRLGKVIFPARVLYNRVPRLWNVALAILRAEASFEIPHELVLLVHARIAQRNGCAFCHDISLAQVVQEQLGMEKFQHLEQWRTHPAFGPAERAALAYAEAVADQTVDDATFAALRAHFSERAIAELTFAAALEGYYNRINHALGIPDDGLLAIARQRRAA